MSKEKAIIDSREIESELLSLPKLAASTGGNYAAMLGIDLSSLNPDKINGLSPPTYGARIPERFATRIWRMFSDSDILQGYVASRLFYLR